MRGRVVPTAICFTKRASFRPESRCSAASAASVRVRTPPPPVVATITLVQHSHQKVTSRIYASGDQSAVTANSPHTSQGRF